MDARQRVIAGSIWIGVAVVMALSIGPTVPSTLSEILRLVVVFGALVLAAVYLLDPREIVSEKLS